MIQKSVIHVLKVWTPLTKILTPWPLLLIHAHLCVGIWLDTQTKDKQIIKTISIKKGVVTRVICIVFFILLSLSKGIKHYVLDILYWFKLKMPLYIWFYIILISWKDFSSWVWIRVYIVSYHDTYKIYQISNSYYIVHALDI